MANSIDKARPNTYSDSICIFPDCVMVAPQILVLLVGVRILLGEQACLNPRHIRETEHSVFGFLSNALVPSSIGLGREILNL